MLGQDKLQWAVWPDRCGRRGGITSNQSVQGGVTNSDFKLPGSESFQEVFIHIAGAFPVWCFDFWCELSRNEWKPVQLQGEETYVQISQTLLEYSLQNFFTVK